MGAAMQGVSNANASEEAHPAPVGQLASIGRTGTGRTCIEVSLCGTLLFFSKRPLSDWAVCLLPQETQAEAEEDIFSTANHMPASVSAGLIEAITIIRDAIRKHGPDSDGTLPHPRSGFTAGHLPTFAILENVDRARRTLLCSRPYAPQLTHFYGL